MEGGRGREGERDQLTHLRVVYLTSLTVGLSVPKFMEASERSKFSLSVNKRTTHCQ